MSLVAEAAGAVLLAGAAVLLAAGRLRSGARSVRVWPTGGLTICRKVGEN
jgi:hypothetical protein